MKFLVFALLVVNAASAHCGGFWETKLVNEQEFAVDSTDTIEILYGSEGVSLLKSKTNSFIIKEYMSRDNSNYYANIINSTDTLTIKRGNRPHFGVFNARVEVYVPAHFIRDISVRTSSGGIKAPDDYTFSRVILHTSSGDISVNTLTAEMADIQTSSGGIRCEKINGNTAVKTSSGGIRLGGIEGNVAAKTSSGSIRFDSIKGDVAAESSSGDIRLGSIEGNLVAKTSSGSINGETVNGNVLAKSTSGSIKINHLTRGIEMETNSGSIYCSAAEIVEDISLISRSGSIELRIPRYSIFNFSSRTSSGSLSTPFPEKLFMPVSDRGFVQGTIGEGTPDNNISTRTTSGSIVVRWSNL